MVKPMRSLRSTLLVALASLACAGTKQQGKADGGTGKDGGGGDLIGIDSNCVPATTQCTLDGLVQTCDANRAWQGGVACAEGLTCVAGACADQCELARSARSYVGCEYWAAPTSNRQLGSLIKDPYATVLTAVGVEGFPFAVALANPGNAAATIKIDGGALKGTTTTTIAAGATGVVKLPWVLELVGAPKSGATDYPATGTRVVAHGGYHIVSNVPIVAYQFNPLTFTDQRRTNCSSDDITCYSFSNDASLLLPASVLGTKYTVISWPTQTFRNDTEQGESPGFAAIVAPGPGDTEVSVTLSSYALVGVGTSEVYRPGETVTRTLHAGDVFQILSAGNASVSTLPCVVEHLYESDPNRLWTCKPDRQTDLTGSTIVASQPVSVFVGHDCAFVPYNRYACDHLEEQLFPNETWGTRYAVSPTAPQLTPEEPTWVRVLSNADGNGLTITPPVAGAPATLDRGEYFDFSTVDGVLVEGTGALLVAQYLVGQQYWSNDDVSQNVGADPDMVLEAPIEQWRSVYDFYVPASYVSSYLNAVVSRGVTPMLDGHAPTAYARVPLGPYDVLQINVSSSPGPHHLEADEPFALKVYGFAPYTSYFYVGGLDLRSITVD